MSPEKGLMHAVMALQPRGRSNGVLMGLLYFTVKFTLSNLLINPILCGETITF